MLNYILNKLGYITKRKCDELIRLNVYNTLVYCEQHGYKNRQFAYEKHMHQLIYDLADRLNVRVEHKLDSWGNLRIIILEN